MPDPAPAPFYADADGQAAIYHGDALALLHRLAAGGLRVDCLLTDPPYSSGARMEAQKPASGAMLRGARWGDQPIENDQMTTTGFQWFIREILLAVAEMLTDGASLFLFTDWRQWPNLVGVVESVNFRVNGMIVWDKGVFSLGNGFRSQHELVLWASRDTPRIYHRATGNVLAHRRVPNDDHPAPKPVGLLRDLLRVVTAPGHTVLDPLMGCGPTLLAARAAGCRAIGIEKVAHYCAIARERLRQRDLFTAAGQDAPPSPAVSADTAANGDGDRTATAAEAAP